MVDSVGLAIPKKLGGWQGWKWEVGNGRYALLAMGLRKILWDFGDVYASSPPIVLPLLGVTDTRLANWNAEEEG